MARKHSQRFDLTLAMTNLDEDELTPQQLGVTAAKSEIIEKNGEDGEVVTTYTEEYVKGPCPAWRAIKYALVAQEIQRNADGEAVSVKSVSEVDKGRRYDLAHYIVRSGVEAINNIKLTDDKTALGGEESDIALILDRCSVVYGIEAFGFIRALLNNPLESRATLDEDEEA